MSLYYEDEYVQLHHGDCRAIRGWTTADVLVTDPPYGISWEPLALNDVKQKRESATAAIAGDEDTAVRDAVVDLWGNRPFMIFGSWRYPLPRKPSHRLIWHKLGRQPGITKAAWFPNDEEVWVGGSGWVGSPSPTVITTTEQRGQEPGRVGHPTPKPIPLMEALIQKCPPGVIADPFAGSGATLIAARNLGRKAIGVELEEKYCELIVKRLSQQAFDFSSLEAS
jgi:site-specific DNA-methyltransferase (adenine-specific)